MSKMDFGFKGLFQDLLIEIKLHHNLREEFNG